MSTIFRVQAGFPLSSFFEEAKAVRCGLRVRNMNTLLMESELKHEKWFHTIG